MQQHERDALAAVIDRQITSKIDSALSPVLEKLREQLQKVEDGLRSFDAQSAIATLRSDFERDIGSIVAKIDGAPRPKDGADGKDADLSEIAKIIKEEVAVAVEVAVVDAMEMVPVPKNGRDADPAYIEHAVSVAVADAVKALPAPKDGADGIGVAGAVIDRSGSLILTLTNGDTKSLGRVIGEDGNDGLGFDDMDVEYDGERTMVIRFSRGDKIKEAEIVMPVVIDRGVWKEADYSAGDGVTWRGSFWIAQKGTRSKPDESSSDWRLAVKRGRDGKDMRQGVQDVITGY